MFSGCLYQMLVDAMGVFLPDDPDGNAKLIFSILDCLPKANRVSHYNFILLAKYKRRNFAWTWDDLLSHES